MPDMRAPIKLGANCWNQYTDWPSFLAAMQRAEGLGYESLWTWDHVYPIVGSWEGPILEAYTAMSAVGALTSKATIGLLVGANTFRNPGIVAKLASTLDHISGGRAILGLGGAWMAPEHTAHGIGFGTGFGQRLDWLDEAVAACRRLLDGETVTSEPGGRYQFRDLRHAPTPIQGHLPIMIGGSGEKKTLRTVAKYADMWNAMGPLEVVTRKVEVLKQHCEAVGRDPSEIEFTLGCKVTIRDSEAEAVKVWKAAMAHNRTPMANVENDATFWNGTPEQLAERLAPYVELGFSTAITENPAPYDTETLERFIGQVKPLVDRG